MRAGASERIGFLNGVGGPPDPAARRHEDERDATKGSNRRPPFSSKTRTAGDRTRGPAASRAA
jgi:hypothetical protein